MRSERLRVGSPQASSSFAPAATAFYATVSTNEFPSCISPSLWLHAPCRQGATLIIQPTPKRSASMPKRGDQKVFVSGIRT